MHSKVKKNIIKLLTWTVFTFSCYGLILLSQHTSPWEIYDSVFLITIILALSIAVTFSNSYELMVNVSEEDDVLRAAIRTDAKNIHAHHSWKIVSGWMTIAPLYLTTTVIVISTLPHFPGKVAHIIVYSILSLLISFSVLIIKPDLHAKHFIANHLVLRKALLMYISIDNPTEKDKYDLISAIVSSHSKDDAMID